MRQQLQPYPPTKTLTVFERMQIAGKWLIFSVFLCVSAIVALPSLLIGFVLCRKAANVFDQEEFWRSLWAMAVFGAVAYGLWLWFANPLPSLVTAIFEALHRELHSVFLPWFLIWLFNGWLAPAYALLLAWLLARRTSSAAQIKQASPEEEECSARQETSLAVEALAQFERMTAQFDFRSLGEHTLVVSPSFPGSSQVLGSYQGGELVETVIQGEFTLPPDLLEVHGVLIGEPRYGKTTTLLRLASLAKQYGWRVFYLDMKGSRKTAALFLAAMQNAGVQRLKLFPLQAYDGWRGDSQALYNRLMQQIDPKSHPFYRSGIGSAAVSLALKAPCGPPRSSAAFLERLDVKWLKTAYAQDSQALRDIGDVAPYLAGVALVFSGFFRGIAGGLDGSWAYEDVEACYIGIDGIAHKEEAALIGRYLLEDAAHFAVARKPQNERAMLVVDEFGALESTNAVTLFESVREAGMSIYVAAQSYQALGREREQILAASALKFLHRCGDPEAIIQYAGERDVYKFSRIVGGEGDEEALLRPLLNKPAEDVNVHSIMRPYKEYTVPIEAVQQLEQGKIVLITGGRGAYIQVHPLLLPQPVLLAAARFIANSSNSQSFPPRLPSAPRRTVPGASIQAGQIISPQKHQKRGKKRPGRSPLAGPSVQVPFPPMTSQSPPDQAGFSSGIPNQQPDQDKDLDFFC